MSHKTKLWGFIQGLGKTFVLPIALLGISGILLGLGSSLTGAQLQKLWPFLSYEPINIFFQYVTMVGVFTFKNMPVLFAIAIPLGLAKEEKGVAAFSGFVGYLIMTMGTNFALKHTGMLVGPDEMRDAGQTMILGVQTIGTGVLGGIFSGVIVSRLHERYKDTKLPDAFAFFGGPHAVPIVSLIVLSVFGMLIPYIWPLFDSLIKGLGYIIQQSDVFGPMIFGASERLLIPLGLHHILTAMIRFTPVGGEAIIDGQQVIGALNIFYTNLAAGHETPMETTALLSQGRMLSFFFGLPAAAFAMYRTAKLKNRPLIKGLLISGAVTAIVSGITEPIEFIFLFISPMLYLFHAFMTGLGYLTLSIFNVNIGPAGDVIGFFVFGVLQGFKTNWFFVPLLGAVWFAAYYFVFTYVIIKKDLKTPGREDDTDSVVSKLGADGLAAHMLEALGGKENIVTIDNCATRLRLVLHSTEIVNDKQLKSAGAIGVVHLDATNLQVVIGPQVHTMRKKIELAMA
ncbi:maltose/glucose-specific PTS transporter subunit IIBC [Vibrio scophthalmi]|uniref:Bifunctional PTS system maltose and glucose-specific transporter subunits IICB n=2 Tax=Vibrio TaxID=662 RepID=F9S357_9VIBR|nr:MULTISPECIES: maltose/glucose-specific PTS transporter subunit IIBC [Vibrio]EGU30842.1 bifunctional PTS system maltose and glucose-specific transporter subunits IICB [Vibrio scophthalmi LMG 19158]EGU38235.1 bifunctional PTS system maltose and glucose-specific transporter subunits IICB [Vibrio ichthyoenteri ATCC 700023]